MATFKRFEEMDSWKIARELSQIIFQFSERSPMSKNFKLRDQILSSAGSTMDNIAEGFGRGNNKEFCVFLGISNGSAREVQSQLYRCLDYLYITKDEFEKSYSLAEEITNKNGKLISYMNKTDIRGIRYKSN